METLDAICLTGAPSSFPMLSLCKLFQRQWHSLYKAVERGTLDTEWLSRYLAQQVPQEGVQYYSLDGSAWPRPRARTMDDRQYVYHPTPAVNGGSICIGYPYSLLDWVPDAHQSWSLSVSVKRIPSEMTAVEMGIESGQGTQPKSGSICRMYWISWLPMASMAMPNSCVPCKVNTVGLWCACDETGFCIGPQSNRRKENVVVQEYMANALLSRNQKPGVYPMKPSHSNIPNSDR